MDELTRMRWLVSSLRSLYDTIIVESETRKEYRKQTLASKGRLSSILNGCKDKNDMNSIRIKKAVEHLLILLDYRPIDMAAQDSASRMTIEDNLSMVILEIMNDTIERNSFYGAMGNLGDRCVL